MIEGEFIKYYIFVINKISTLSYKGIFLFMYIMSVFVDLID